MARLTQDEINGIATKYKKLRARAKKTRSARVKQEYKNFQNFCFQKLSYLVSMRTYKYQKFPNYHDLQQVGFEALLSAINTYKEEKGSFTWWADKYIKTRISRAANAHSTIRFPIKKAKEMKPYKTSCIPIMVDTSPNPFQNVEGKENKERVQAAIDTLPPQHRLIVNMTFGTNGGKPKSMSFVIKDMDISRQQYIKLLEEAKEQIRKHLTSHA